MYVLRRGIHDYLIIFVKLYAQLLISHPLKESEHIIGLVCEY